MRLKKVKDADIIVKNSKYVINNPKDYIGKWNSVFDNNNPIYIEIGTGRGKFITSMAINNKDINYIGIEKYDSALVTGIKRLNDMDTIDNLRFICMDALEIDSVFDKEIDRIYLTFSDPWPKKRHTKRRLSNSIFLEKYDKLFKNCCIIEMKTDNDEFFEYSVNSFIDYGYDIESISNDFNDIYKTEYEEKFIYRGKNINHVIVKK